MDIVTHAALAWKDLRIGVRLIHKDLHRIVIEAAAGSQHGPVSVVNVAPVDGHEGEHGPVLPCKDGDGVLDLDNSREIRIKDDPLIVVEACDKKWQNCAQEKSDAYGLARLAAGHGATIPQ